MSVDKNSRFLPSKMLREATRKQAYGVYFGLSSDYNFGKLFNYPEKDQKYQDSDLCACAFGVLYEAAYGKPFDFREYYLGAKVRDSYPYLYENIISEEEVFDKVKDFLTDIELVELVDNVFYGDYKFDLEKRTLINNKDDGRNDVTLVSFITRANDKAKFSFNTLANILEVIGY